jgi:ubiquinone/menaquinone biosynthesis C-methylase UbiE
MSNQANSIAVNSFNENHTDYDTFRPDFGAKIVNPFLVELGLAKVDPATNQYSYDTNKVILELAAGTGKFTKRLVENGWGDSIDKSNLVIVEPSEGMLKSLRLNFPTINPGNIHNSSSYEIPVPDNSIDAIIVAQGFHWFSDVASLKEMNRILKPSGSLGLIWNGDYAASVHNTPVSNCQFINGGTAYFDAFVNPSPSETVLTLFSDYFGKQPWSNKCCEYIYTFDGKVPQYRKDEWKKALISKENSYFTFPDKEIYLLYDISLDENKVYEYWGTRSYITVLDEEQRKTIKQTIDKIVKEDTTPDSYNEKGYLIKPMITHAISLRVQK